MNSDRTIRDARVLISGDRGRPTGGIAVFYEALLNSSLEQHVRLSFVQSSTRKRILANSGRWSFSNLASAAADCARFAFALASHRPQISHIATAFGLSFVKNSVFVLLARLMGSGVLLHPHCSITLLYTHQSKLWRWYFRQIARLTHGVIALSHEWEQLRDIVPTCNVYYLPNGIDLGPFDQVAQQRLSLDGNRESLRVLYLGALGKAKGTFDLIHAATRLLGANNLIFDLVGDEHTPGELQQLKALVTNQKLNSHLNILPPVVLSAKIEQFRRADVFVYPSYHEGMPMAIIEAMACALPIVATRVGGIPDLVTNEVNGLLVEAGKPDALAEAIRRVIVDPELRHTMQANSHRSAKDHFDIEKTVPQLLNIYKSVLQPN